MRNLARSRGLGVGTLLFLALAGQARAAEPEQPPEGTSPAPEGQGEAGRGGAGGADAGQGATDAAKPPEGGGQPDAGKPGEGEGAKPEKKPGEDATAAAKKRPPAGAGDEAGGVVPEEAAAVAEPPHEGRFEFGSYGRVIAATDGSGRPGRETDIVAHGSRIDLGNYAELELRREDHWDAVDADTKIVTTLAIGNPIFHWNGEFDSSIAVRNLFIEERDLGAKGLSIWAGSRMLRGDDIYLLDFWPLDNLNTVGGGLRYGFCGEPEPAAPAPEGAAPAPAKAGAAKAAPPPPPPPWCTALSAHLGIARPTNPFYAQDSDRAEPLNQFGQATVDILDRQRFIGSFRGEQIVRFSGQAGLKAVLYGEVHGVPSAQQETEAQSQVYEELPGDTGWVVGGQVGLFSGERDTHLNLFVRYAGGIAAYGEFAMPDTLALDLTTSGAHELVLGTGGNWEYGPVAVTLGAYFRSFRNANGELDYEDVDEGIVLLRPHLFFADWAGVAVEGSYQAQQRGVLTAGLEDPTHNLELKPLFASVGRVGVIPFISPAGQGAFKRPWIYVSYMASFRNDGARELYPESDVFRIRDIEHFVGVGAEWWFSSSSYGGQ
jgi:maltoporin